MKQRVVIAVVFFFLSAGLTEAEELKIGTVDVSRAFDSFQKTKNAENILEAEGNKKKDERNKRVEEVKRLKAELDLLSEEGKEEKQALINQKVQELQRFDREVRESLGRERERAIQEILKEIKQTIEKYGRDNGFTYLFSEGAVLYKSKETDVTDAVVNLLNQNYQGKKR